MTNPYTKGAAVITSVVLLLALSLIVVNAGSRLVIGEASRTESYSDSQESFRVGESVVEDAIYRLKQGYTVTSGEVTPVGASSSAPVFFTSSNGVQTVSATGTIDATNRGLTVTASNGIGVGFPNLIHAGTSGISMSGGPVLNGDVFSNAAVTLSGGSRINGDATAVTTITNPPGTTITGAKTTGAPSIPLPSLDQAFWKAQANINNNPYVGNMTLGHAAGIQNLGPRKIQGNLTMSSDAHVQLSGPLHVTGNLSMSGAADLTPAASFGSQGTVIIVDGTVSIGGGADVRTTTATPKGYILIQSNSTNSTNAIVLSGGANIEVIFVSPEGGTNISGGATAIAVAAKKITMSGGATLGYDSIGFPSATFGTGGSGGGFQVETWGENR